MKWLFIPWSIALAWFALACVALGNATDALIASVLPALVAAIVTVKVLNTYQRWIADQAAAARIAEAMSWNLPEPGEFPANQNQKPFAAQKR